MSRISLPETAHRLIEKRLRNGDIAIDATLGNGHDTLFLARHVGTEGHVYGFDIQSHALDSTRARLTQARLIANVTLFHASHADMVSFIPPEQQGRIQAVMFNLGYLPGSDKTVITRAESTLTALGAACEALAPAGVMTILAYPGHAGGDLETEQVQQWLERLEPSHFHCTIYTSSIDKPGAPRLFYLEKGNKLLS
ncbi:class I SAM-dependent methyltransferase [Methylomarinum vadi]|uniref:class I SAM-dependent methyltransferase n=1 Tax=Methylomarinum vadi TaxID=438855 RepID=UPI0004DEE5D6|nr:class I SAM-dependent methyltransferase [Methylomarinum vadi]